MEIGGPKERDRRPLIRGGVNRRGVGMGAFQNHGDKLFCDWSGDETEIMPDLQAGLEWLLHDVPYA